MKVLVVGGGGREHAIVDALTRSGRIDTIYCAPGNAGIAAQAECVPIRETEVEALRDFALAHNVTLTVVGPEAALAAGIVDCFRAAGLRIFGPTKAAARIESSKEFAKELMAKYGIPTADYAVFSDPKEVVEYVEKRGKFPVVIKADGLALGKGVIIAQNFDEAKDAVHTIMEDKVFGASGNNVVVEEFLTGPEVSVLAFTDGKTLRPMVSSKDHKRALDGDKGLNTGGMGTISPNPYYTNEIADECMKTIFLPTVKAMQAEGRPFKGCLYFGLMLTPDGPKVIEYNARFGDPETQVVLPRLKTDFVDVINAVIDEKLDELEIEWISEACACVVMASGGYPQSYPKGLEITGLDENGQAEGVTVYHAGTKLENGKLLTNGGRVLGVTATAKTLDEALEKAYAAVEKIHFDGAHYRRDIGRTK